MSASFPPTPVEPEEPILVRLARAVLAREKHKLGITQEERAAAENVRQERGANLAERLGLSKIVQATQEMELAPAAQESRLALEAANAEEGLSEDELALFDLLSQGEIGKADRERLKQASKGLLASLQELLKPIENWTQKEQTQAEVKVFILDRLFETLPNPPYSTAETQAAADRIYEYVWQRSANGNLFPPDMAA